jgi:large subunit ribosomal protein L7/L12
MGFSMGGGGGAAAPVEEEIKEVKTAFDVKLVSFDAKNKIKIIKEVRAITGLGLKEAKDLVENVPGVLKKDVKKEDADALVALLAEIGGVVELE